MTNAQKIRLRLSKVRQRLNEISGLEGDAFTDEIRSEAATLQTEYADLETRHQAAIVAESEPETREAAPDAEMRARIELRSRAMLSNYLIAAVRGRAVTGAESELQDAAGCGSGGIPLELWDVAPRVEAREQRDVTPAPGTVGVNLDRIRPQVFANSIAPRLGIDMPRVMSGTYASATITTSQGASPKAKSAAIAATAGALTVTTATPKRISARLELSIEDIAAVGQENFESILRENLSLALSDALDNQIVNGDRPDSPSGDQAAQLEGVFSRLTDPTAPSAVADFDAFAASHAAGVDGLWAGTIKDVSIVCGPATYVLASKTFQSATNYKGETSAAAYAMQHTGGFWTNKRMPAAASMIQPAILYRTGRSMMGGAGAMRTAVCPHWNEVGIDDIYSGSAKGERYFTLHVLIGDVILVQPDAYAQVAFKVA